MEGRKDGCIDGPGRGNERRRAAVEPQNLIKMHHAPLNSLGQMEHLPMVSLFNICLVQPPGHRHPDVHSLPTPLHPQVMPYHSKMNL